MGKILLSLVLTVVCNTLYAQVGSEMIGGSVTPQNNDPAPYDAVIILEAPGSAITSGDYNTVVGDGAGSSLTSGDQNVFIGTGAGTTVDNDSDIIAIGAFALDQSGTSNFDNVVIGTRAARTLNSGDNVIIGTEAGMVMTSASDNVIIGEEAAQALTTGDDNTIIGEDAGYNLTTGSDNCLIGSRAGSSLIDTRGSTFVGSESNTTTDYQLDDINSEYYISTWGGGVGEDNTTGLGNTFIGSGAGADNGAGNVNTFVGYGAGFNTEHGDGNTFVGYAAGYDNNRTNSTSNANRNTYLGMRSGGTNRDGSDNVGIGYYADFNNTNRSRSTFIGSYAKPYNNDVTMLGYNTRVGGRYGMALGLNTRVDNNYAVAIGTNVTVAQNNTMALGGDTTTNRLSVGIGTVTANRNASLELADVDKGLLINRVTTAERTTMETTPASGVALTTTDAGLMVYDTDVKGLFSWDGAAWSAVDTNTDEQAISLATNTLSITGNAGTVDLSGYLDNTDSQELSLAINTLSISGGTNTIDLSAYVNTDAQDLSLSGTTLSLTNDGTSVDLSVLQDGTGTDSQELSLATNTLSISGGTNTVDLSAYVNTDGQDLTSATLTGTTVDIEIENGASVSVDLAPLLADLENRVTILEACACPTLRSDEYTLGAMNAVLHQNIPNPFNGTSTIGYYIPRSVKQADIIFSNNLGQIIKRVNITTKAEGEISINSSNYASGMYYYTLYLDGKKVATKKMIVE